MLNVPGLPPVLGLVCYEALFPRELAQGQGRAGVIINVTNDGWFGNTTGPRQHFHQARVRAVEQGLPIVRAANNGISGVIDGYGRVLVSAGMNVAAVIDSPLPQPVSEPPFARLGETIFAAMLAACAGLAFRLGRKAGD
jgi:apolipoprotein N-acyltransferase